MITFTPLSGAAHARRTTPLCYLLQLDDVRILLDCGSPDWVPEPSPITEIPQQGFHWDDYCNALRASVVFRLILFHLTYFCLQNTGLRLQSTLFYFHMETLPTLAFMHTHTLGGI
jgi:cleavage and polyadenylation specificity factor subunit 2